MLDELAPEDFVLSVFALLSYYRNLYHTQVFVPITDCEDYLSEFANFRIVGTESNGRVLERVVFSVIHACRSLLPGVLAIPYLRLYQFDACMEHTRSTTALEMYCYTRASRTCFHHGAVDHGAVDGVCRLLGFAVPAPVEEEAGLQEAMEEQADLEEETSDNGQTVLEGVAKMESDIVSEDLFSSQNDCPTESSADSRGSGSND